MNTTEASGLWNTSFDSGKSHEVYTDFNALLKSIRSCEKHKDLHKARSIHESIIQTNLLERDIRLGHALVSVFAKCGAFRDARNVFDKIPGRNIRLWNILISGCVRNCCFNEAINFFKQMKDEGLSPDVVTYTCILKACASIQCVEMGEDICIEVRNKRLLEKDLMLGTAMVDMYAKCGVMEKAQLVFEDLPLRDVVSWNALIGGYVRHGHATEALNCFEKMQEEGFLPNAMTFSCVLKACGSIGSLDIGEEVHRKVMEKGLLEKDIVLGTAIVDMYAMCGVFGKAREVFEKLPMRNNITWNVLISGYVQYGLNDEALHCFFQMRNEGHTPDVITFVCLCKACGSLRFLKMAEDIHSEVRKRGLLEKNVVLGTALVDMYSKCGQMVKAREVFDKLGIRNVISWSALISGYAQLGIFNEALNCFLHMRDDGLSPDAITFSSLLKACSMTRSLKVGEEIHAQLREQGLLEKDRFLGIALIDMYAKCNMLGKAREMVEKLAVQDVVSWSALITGYSQHGLRDEALDCFHCMQDKGISPDAITFICVLKVCGSMGSLEMGGEIHLMASKQGLLQKDTNLGNALIDMYAKCGALKKSQEMFNELPTRNVVSWNGLMAGFAQFGDVRNVFELFDEMITQGVTPDVVTILILLSACNHAGLVDEGQMIFNDMERSHYLAPTIEHYTCMVDLLTHVGQFDKAVVVIQKMSYSDRLPLWLTFLGSCSEWVNLELGKWAFRQSLLLDKECPPAYICMGNLYAATMHEEHERSSSFESRVKHEE